jgi:hypothetical protein
MKKTAPLFLAILALSGCGLFTPSPPAKVSGDTNGVAVKGGTDSTRWEFATNFCATFNKAAMLLPSPPESARQGIATFACR